MRTSHLAFSAACALVCALPAQAFAQSEADRATARSLAQQGEAAYETKDYKKSEDAFRRADALYHAPTLSIGLARAQVAEGKFVEAWENYNRVILEGVTTTPAFAKALTDAKAEIGAIEGRRARVTIAVTGSDAPKVTIDDRPIKSEALGIAFFVDPGPHTIVASAAGFNPETRTFTATEGKSESVAIPLTAAPVAAVPPPGLGSAPPPNNPPAADTGAEATPNHVPAFVAFGVGAAGLVTGIITGVLAIGKHDDLSKACMSTTCDPSQQSNIDSYHTLGIVSTVGFVVAGVGAAAGVTLWVAMPKTSAHASTSAWIAPYVAPTGVGAVGQF
ncbi:MAG TPA: hypothetical protein VK841_21070 [Polyangiaceae bacterium]|jgi:hypothetical protein|nr:hypothetical protein [Polyangiaceae bacterium]